MRAPFVVLGLLVVGLVGYGIAVDSPFVAFYAAVTVVAGIVLGAVHRSVDFDRPLVWALVAVIAGNLAGGVLLVGGSTLYVHRIGDVVPYDLLFHVLASGVGAWAAAVVISRRAPGSPWAAAAVAALAAAGGGAVVEVAEFTGTLLLPNTNVGDYRNNMLDLAANLAGAVIGATLSAARSRTVGRGSRRRGRVEA